MRPLLYLLIFLPFIAHSSNSNANWKLVWQEDFSQSNFLNTSKWAYVNRNYINPPKNWNTENFNMASCLKVENDNLVLTAFVKDNRRAIGCGIQTLNKISILYGKVEVRAKIESAQGINSAIWLLADKHKYHPNDIVWDKYAQFNGEIDLVEHINFNTTLDHSVHNYLTHLVTTNKLKLPVSFNPSNHVEIKKNVGNYVVYSIEIFKDKLIYYVDGEKTFEYQKVAALSNETQFPFDQNFYLLIEQGIGEKGSWQGPVNFRHLPVKMYIDWVKFYAPN